MNDPEAQLRELMLIDAKVFRVRNQIAEKTDPNAKKYKTKAKKPVKVEPDDITPKEPQP